MFRLALAGALILVAVASVQTKQDTPALQLVESVDLKRYAGSWYEIARFPNRFQDKCASDVTAMYTLRHDGLIDVVNRCRRENGALDAARGVARKVDEAGSAAALQVRFAPAFVSFLPWVWGDYRIIGLDPHYRWAVVGDPSREYLWILARTPSMAEADYERAVAIARANHFDVNRLQKTRQSTASD